MALALCACGGGSSSTDRPASAVVATQLVAGFVEDGPIVDARIFLVNSSDNNSLAELCGASGRGRCETRTDDAGHFSLLLRKDLSVEGLLVVAKGGRDGRTGVDFSALEQSVSLEFFSAKTNQVVVSPLTTLVTHGWQSGQTLTDALQVVASNLQLSGPPNQLLSRPSTNPDLLNRTLLLSKMAFEFSLQNPGEEPFGHLALQLVQPRISLFGLSFPEPSLLSDLGFGLDIQQRIEEMRLALAANGAQQEQAFIEEELFQGFRSIVDRSLAGLAFDSSDPLFVSNGHHLAAQIMQATAPALVPLNGVVPQRLSRYLLHAYGLDDPAVLTLPLADFDLKLQGNSGGGLPAVVDNPQLAELATLTSLYSVKVPLLTDDLPGDDNGLRAAYYYGSDISHLYQAEKLIGLVSDDAINDPLMVEIVDGKAAAGLFPEAEAIARTQIYQSAEQADAWLELGRSEVDFGRYAEALPHLDTAYAAISKVLANKTAALMTSHDSHVMASIAANYRKAGALTKATQVLNDLQQLAAQVPSTSTYGKFFIGIRNIAEDFLAAGDLVQATALIDDLLPLARLAPANVKVKNGISYSYDQLRVFNLREVLRLNAALGRSAEVWQIYQEIQALRANDGLQNLTLNETWFDISQVVEELYRSGFASEALTLADSIPLSYSNYYGASRSGIFYRNTAFMSVATWEALNNGYSSGLAVLNAHFSDVSDKVEGLTYYALNKGNERIGLSLLQAGRLAEAVQALDDATLLLDGLTETSDRNIYRNLIERGYVKVADLYSAAGDQAAATGLLGKAEQELAPVVGVDYRIDGLVSIALGYHQLGMAGARDLLFNQAFGEIQGAAAQLSQTEMAQLYQSLADGLVESGQRSGALSQAVDALVTVALDIHDPVRDAAAADPDKLAENEVKYLLLAAEYQSLMNDSPGAMATLQAAEQAAGQIFVDTRRMDQLVKIAAGFAASGLPDEALALALNLPFVSSRNEALQAIAHSFSLRDDFPGQPVASIDTDGDGLPNFWSPLATADEIAASGLVLDPDCDNDGVADIIDNRPLYVDP